MKRLDVAIGDWVRIRNGGYAEITRHNTDLIAYKEAVLNGFNGVLWYERPQLVRVDGRESDIPSPNDIVGFVTWKSGLLSDKPIQTEVQYI